MSRAKSDPSISPHLLHRDYGLMMTRSIAQIHIPILNGKSCNMYKNLNFLQKKWLSIMKNQRLGIHNDNHPKYLGYLKEKLSSGVHSPWQYTFNTNGILLFLAPQNDG